MQASQIEVLDYEGGRDPEIAAFILSIQNKEAGLDLGIADQPDLLDITRAYRSGGFWIALDGHGAVVGSIGLLVFGQTGVLKKFFVAEAFRGGSGPARLLMGTLLARGRALGLTDIVLDTPAIARRSHAFYERNGFERIWASDLPATYHFPDRDSLLYRLRLKAGP